VKERKCPTGTKKVIGKSNEKRRLKIKRKRRKKERTRIVKEK